MRRIRGALCGRRGCEEIYDNSQAARRWIGPGRGKLFALAGRLIGETLPQLLRRCPLTYYGGKELAASFRQVRKNTLTIAQEIPEDKYSFRPAPNTRSVGELLTHIAVSYTFQYQIQAVERRSSLVGFDFPSLMKTITAEEKTPRSKEQILELLRTNGEKWAGWLDGVKEELLAEPVGMPPGA